LPPGISKSAGRLPETQVAPDLATRLEILIDKLLLARYAPPSVIINSRGDIVRIHGRTGAYLEPAPGQPRLNLLAMAREGLRLPLTGVIRQAASQQDEIILQPLQVKTNGDTSLVRLTVQQIFAPAALHGLLRVSFEPVAETAPPAPLRPRPRGGKRTAGKNREAELEQELRTSQAELQRTQEELDTSYEEFQSTNEEMQSTNEELESTKEELQSLNEELQTVNAELQSKVEMLSETNDDMDNLLNSTDIATIFLDNHLCVKRFTPKSNELFRLIQSDIGRPLSDLTSSLNYEHLMQDAEAVLRTLDSKDREVQTKTDTWYLMRMRPYRTARNVIDGVVVTFVDTTRLKQAEAARQAAEAAARRYAENIVQAIRQPLVILDAELQVVSANQSFYQLFSLTPETTTHQYLYDVGHGQWDLPELRHRLSNVLARDTAFEGVELTYEVPHLGRRLIRLNAHRMQQPGSAGCLTPISLHGAQIS
jgi:two-component system CheB/CheR fusion protein